MPRQVPIDLPGMHGIPPTLGTPLATKHCPVIGSARCPIGQAPAGAASTTGAAANSAPHAAASSALEIRTRTAMSVSLLRTGRSDDHDRTPELGSHTGGVQRPQPFTRGAHAPGRDQLVVELD